MSVPMTMRRLLVGVSAGVLLTGLVATAPVQAAQSAPADSLTDLVTAELLSRSTSLAGYAGARADDTRITMFREKGRWAFGAAVLVAPAGEDIEPRDWLFLAERRATGWRFHLDGEFRGVVREGSADLRGRAEDLRLARRSVRHPGQR
jgi:LasA protease